jgi:hypothetical protein
MMRALLDGIRDRRREADVRAWEAQRPAALAEQHRRNQLRTQIHAEEGRKRAWALEVQECKRRREQEENPQPISVMLWDGSVVHIEAAPQWYKPAGRYTKPPKKAAAQ